MKPQTLAEYLRPYRQDAVAEAVGVAKTAVHGWYHGRTFPRDEHLPKLAQFLRITVSELAAVIADDRRRRSLERVAEIA